ncbi:signal peptidase complex subunit 1-like [Daphnia pulicaria]|uniref:signal peptidase complex subunit 1-like n=1 Tax=Daphnia pulicaria TaxID=35523 RepID=UPI001EEBD537|nr:signal peptidase complex subunit 1-like [Daphnia pulicaria]
MAFNFDTHMDYEGQHFAEKLSHIIVVVFGVIGWVIGYVNQQFSQTILVLGVGVLIAAIVTLPPWPMYRRKSLNWRKPRKEVTVDTTKTEQKEVVTTASKQKKKNK